MAETLEPRESNTSQAIFVGFAGFSFVLLSLTLFYFKTFFFYFDAGGYPAPLIVAVSVTLLLFAGAAANDFLITRQGGIFLETVSAIGGVVAPVAYFLSDFNVVFLPIIAFGTVSALFMWGSYLASQKHQLLLFVTAVAFVFAGVFSVLVLELSLITVAIAVAVLYLLAWICSLYVKGNLAGGLTLESSAHSRARRAIDGGNRFTLITIGFLLGVSLMILCKIDLGLQTTIFTFSGSVTVAGFAVLLLRSRFQRTFEDVARRSLGVAAALCLVPLPFVPSFWQIICMSVLLFVIILNFIILIDAVAETARFNMISPVWITGIEGGICALGGLCGLLVFWGSLQCLEYTEALILASVSSVIICSFMQIFIENQAYPFLENAIDDGTSVRVKEVEKTEHYAGRGGAGWREKLDVVTERYELSPRQREVMELLAKGRDAKYIMQHFYISRSTTKTHIYNLYKKLEVHSRQEMLDLIEHTEINR
jgi:DNA-binding CsgD family transcriptional regulator